MKNLFKVYFIANYRFHLLFLGVALLINYFSGIFKEQSTFIFLTIMADLLTLALFLFYLAFINANRIFRSLPISKSTLSRSSWYILGLNTICAGVTNIILNYSIATFSEMIIFSLIFIPAFFLAGSLLIFI
jgi:hypothetical protein